VKEIPAGKAVIYTYRISTYAAAIHYKVNANDNPVMDSPLLIGSYMVYFADPGKVNLWSETGKHRGDINLEVKAGKSYFVEGFIKSDAWTSKPGFTEVPEQVALKAIHKCRLITDE
jgi:hypothetical protein